MDNKTYQCFNKLDTKWVLWYHDPDDKRWSLESYKELCVFSTLEEFLSYYDEIKTFVSGMFFLMKEGIPPIWEDPQNIKGGIMTYKLLKNISDKAWVELSMLLIGGTLSEDYTNINGISISPKINNCIIKIWVKSSNAMNTLKFNAEIDLLKNYQPIHKVFS